MYPWSKFWLSILVLKVERTFMSFKSSSWAFEDAGGSWLGFGILIMIWIWSLVLHKPVIQILYLLSWLWQCREHPCPSPNLGLGGCWRFLNQVLLLHNYLDIFIGLWYTNVPNFCSISWIWRCKEHPYPLSPHFWSCRMLEVHDWGLAFWSLFGFGQEPCLDLHCSFHYTKISKR